MASLRADASHRVLGVRARLPGPVRAGVCVAGGQDATGAYNSLLQLRGKLDFVIKQKSGRVEDAAVDRIF